MTRVWYVVVGVSCLLVGFLAHAQVAQFDPTKPDAVARAYLDACEKWDLEAATQCLDPKGEGADLRDLMQNAFPEGFRADQMLTEMLLLPSSQHAKYALGELKVEGDTAQLPLTVTVTLPQTLVLHKGQDGNWIVELRKSITASTGLPEPIMVQGLGQAPMEACQANLGQLGLAVMMWAQDHDEVLPPAANWTQELMPYLKSDRVFRCPGAPELECGYAYNLAVAGTKLAQMPNPAETVLFYETTLGMPNPADLGESQPKPGRHNAGNSMAYVDGHVKWLADQP
jgi:prepilin-type processing-associated H-X9-DG protein